MKNFVIVASIVACSAVGFAGGELPNRRPVPPPVYAATVQVEKVGFLKRTANFGKNVVADSVGFVKKGADVILNVGTLGYVDICNNDANQPGYWN